MHSAISSQAAHHSGLMELEFSRSTLYTIGAAITLTLLAFLAGSDLVRPLAWATAAISVYAIADYTRAARLR